MDELEIMRHQRLTKTLESKNRRFVIVWLLLYVVVGLIFIAFAGVQIGKYSLERARIDATSAMLSIGTPQPVAGPGPAPSTAGSAPVDGPLYADKQISDGVYILRGMLEVLPEALAKDKSGNSGASVEWSKFANIAIDKLVGAGKMTVKEANSLRQELLKPTIDVGVYAAKAAVDRFISGKAPAKSENTDKAGAGSNVGNHVEITMYGVKEHIAVVPAKAKPKSPTKPVSCDKAPVTDKRRIPPEAACKTNQDVNLGRELAEPKASQSTASF